MGYVSATPPEAPCISLVTIASPLTNLIIEIVHVRNLSPPRFQRKMIDTLVMDKDRRRTLISLTESYARLNLHGKRLSQALWQADFVEKKGKGLIFLLHGGPGVGKTFTAGKPLLLTTIFYLASDCCVYEKLITDECHQNVSPTHLTDPYSSSQSAISGQIQQPSNEG